MKDLRTMKVEELKDIARGYGIVGAWKMTKDKLIESILKNAEANGHTEYIDSAAQDVQDEPENTESTVDDEVIEEPEADESEDEEEKPKKPRGKLIEYNGKAQTLGKWADELGFTPQTLYARLYLSNWPVDKAFETPSRRKVKEEE